MNNIYIKFNENREFVGFYLDNHPDYDENCILITEAQHAEYLKSCNQQGKKVVLNEKNDIEIVDKYTADELKQMQIENTKQQLIAQAKQLLKDNANLWTNQILWSNYSVKEKQIITDYYDGLTAVASGESDVIPELKM